MKALPKFITIAFFALLCFTSCQKEVIQESPVNEEELITAESGIVSLMQATSARNGTLDNILDNANCLSINLPVTVIVNDITITINTLEDLELIEDIFDEFDNDEDVLELLFPITIVLNDHTEIVINSQEELDAFVEACSDETDDDIKCVDFVYPISFSIYNSEFQIIDTVIIENDRELHEFLETINESDQGALLVSLNFPVKLVYANGEIIEVFNHQELERVLNDARENCEEEEACRKEAVDMYLKRCHWEVHRYNGDDHLRELNLYFGEDGVLQVVHENNPGANITGLWSTRQLDNGVILSISELTEFDEALAGDWFIVECDDDKFELVRENSTGTTPNSSHMLLKKECEEDPGCTGLEMRMFLKECHWFAGSNLIDNTGTSNGLRFYFEENGVLLVVSGDWSEEYIGAWQVEVTSTGIILVIELPEPYAQLSRRWKLYECGELRVKLASEDYYIIFERDCENDNPFECFIETAGSGLAVLSECDGETDDDRAIFDLTLAYKECDSDLYAITYHEDITAADTSINEITNPTEYQNLSNPQTVYARVELNSGRYEVFEINLVVEYCQANCTKEQVDTYLLECIWIPVSASGSDDLGDYRIDFKENGDLLIVSTVTNEEFSGYWATTQLEDNVKIELANINGPNIQILNDFWYVIDCREDRLEVRNNNEITVVIERDCS
jgi:hypothetical protein